MILRAVTVRGVKSVEQSQENFTEFAYSKSMTISLVWLCKTRKKICGFNSCIDYVLVLI